MFKYFCILLLPVLVIGLDGKLHKFKKSASPPHCTQVTKDTDYLSKFKLDYPVAYIVPGQHEAYQKMYCLNPPIVNKAVTTVCDWAAPPQVQFTLGDDFVHVVRQDPTGRFLGNAVINTYQLCGHNISHVDLDNEDDVFVMKSGEHVDGEKVSFLYNGVVPAFKPIYKLNVTTQNQELKPQFNYLRVEYYNLMSDVSVTYDPATLTLDFHVKFPFVDTPVGILGFSMPK